MGSHPEDALRAERLRCLPDWAKRSGRGIASAPWPPRLQTPLTSTATRSTRRRSTRDRSRCGEARSRPPPPTSGCSTPRGPTDWVHTDPWRVLRIQAEFVEGFGALAELGPAVSVFGSARTARDTDYERASSSAGRSPRPASRSSPAVAPARWRRPTAARPGRRGLGRARHRAAVRVGPQRVGRPRHQLPLLLRPQDDVREVRAGLHRAAGWLRHVRRDLRGAGAGADPQGDVVPDGAGGHRLLGWADRVGATRVLPRGRSTRRTSRCSR